ncbi:hypothetical protein HK097_000092 [Rhizophlyctis rosea]|uniref:NADP-dependent oxidoreductase domain-containing protein n=1 Tax=Rhizophlyctis rosea TaxID=64517 RepID=A0AAD5X3R2_9FUNG|nr:hypothetical protein HK097_000092 [Rhizophlyctis rosea]
MALESPHSLGGIKFGNEWELMRDTTKNEAFSIMDRYFSMGGNFIDTANNYQNGQSEQWIGECMEERKNRDEIVLATKYSCALRPKNHVTVNSTGNSAKSIYVSVERSLNNLKTEYIDILYLHWWDDCSPIKEIMHTLHHLVQYRKVLYLGISDTPAWIVAAANTYAEDHALTPFTIYQSKYSPASRDAERDILPMCKRFGMAFAPFGVLESGRFQRLDVMRKEGESGRMDLVISDRDEILIQALEEVAKEVNGNVGQGPHQLFD